MQHQPGPVITISREHGCDATKLSKAIAEKINSGLPENNKLWRCINKEILEAASTELKLSTSKIANRVITHHDNIIEDLFNSFANHYDVPDTKILNTIKEVIQLYAHQGNAIIIGRGGVFITNDILHSLHIKLQAPFLWRVAQIQTKFKITHKEATAQCTVMDEKRKAWNNEISKTTNGDTAYDLILNTSTFSKNQLLNIIFTALKGKKVIPSTL